MKITFNIDNDFIYGFASLAGIGKEVKELSKGVKSITLNEKEIKELLGGETPQLKAALACLVIAKLSKDKED